MLRFGPHCLLLIRGLLVVGGLLLVGCSGQQDETSSADSPAAATATVEPTATPKPTVTPAPSPTPIPTLAPTPEPIFVRSELPVDAASSETFAMWSAAMPTSKHPWVGFGHRYRSTTGTSVPILWTVPDTGEQTFERLPLVARAQGGNVFEAEVAFDSQLAAGSILLDSSRRAALWTRTDEEWQLDIDFAPDLLHPDRGESSVWSLEGGDNWAMLVAGLESPTEVDDEGDPAFTRYVLISTMLGSWQPLELDGVNADDWLFGIHIDGDRGLVSARLDDDEAPAVRFFTTNDSGATWRPHQVQLDQEASITAVLFEAGDDLTIVGSVGPEDARRPAVFAADEAGNWSVQPSDLTMDDLEPFENSWFSDIQRLSDSELLAIVDTDPGLTPWSTRPR